ncbi:MAG TPA: 2OG-Fe(II) oxygenase [Fluviicoccus sp.]|nr:2OG-Fe(II) oxygenase [Fluviicoccus sp.]
MNKQAYRIGEPAPWFVAPSSVNPAFHFDTLGGHHIVLCFLGDCRNPAARSILESFLNAQAELSQREVVFLAVTCNPDDQPLSNLISYTGYVKFIWDFNQHVSSLYGCIEHDSGTASRYRPVTVVINSLLQIAAALPWRDPSTHASDVLDYCRRQPQRMTGVALAQAPVLRVPGVLSADDCSMLIRLYRESGGNPSGFMRLESGRTVPAFDPDFKRRRDIRLEDHPDMQRRVSRRIETRLLPYIRHALRFDPTRFERYVVGCYDARDHGTFLPHRDNTSPGTRHRRFAMSLPLNEDYIGGDLRFPEFGMQRYRPAAGEAIVFSAALLHEVTPVTRGERFVLLCFFHDEADAKLRGPDSQDS